MSLINDALKQARQSQPSGEKPGEPPLRPVAPAPRGAADWILPLAVVALVGAAAFFIWLALAGHKTPPAKAPEIAATRPASPVPAVVSAVSAAAPAPKPAPASVPAPATVPAIVPAQTSVPPIAIATNKPVVPKKVAADQSLLPTPKLQGIIYGRESWAIVDGRTVHVGDRVQNFRVKEISQSSITLEGPDGSEKKLLLGE